MPSRSDWASRMRSDWDTRAQRMPYWFIDPRVGFDDPDLQAFRRYGEADLRQGLECTGFRFRGNETVLDLGCGAGRMTGAIADRAGSVVGIDIAPRMLSFARDQLAGRPNVALVQTDGVSLAAFADRSFDVVVCHAVYQHLPTMEVVESYTAEVARVLGEKGTFLAALQNWSYSPYRWAKAAAAWTINYRDFRNLGVYSKTFLGPRLTGRRVRSIWERSGLQVDVYRPIPYRRAWVRATRGVR